MYSNKLNNYQDKKTFNCLLHWQSLPRVGRGGGGGGRGFGIKNYFLEL